MLNLFPGLLIPMLGPVILRLTIGLIFIDLGILKFRTEKPRWITSFEGLGIRPADLFVTLYAIFQVIGGLLLLIGLWTQGVALLFVIFTGIELYIEWEEGAVLKRDLVFYLLMFIISLSLLLSGAGAYAIDIPL